MEALAIPVKLYIHYNANTFAQEKVIVSTCDMSRTFPDQYVLLETRDISIDVNQPEPFDIIALQVDQLRGQKEKIPDALVLYNNDRGQFIRKTFNNRWLKAVRAAQSELGRQLDYTFHDIKAKAISDFEGSSRDKQIFSGHKTESQVLIYDRKVQISPTLDRPVIGEK